MKVFVDKQSDKPHLPYRVRCMGFTVSMKTEDEAKRIKRFTEKLLKENLCPTV